MSLQNTGPRELQASKNIEATARLSPKKLHSQAILCVESLQAVCRSVFESGTPADKALGAIFRQDRRMGSRDRAMVSQAVFAVFRWWGWLQILGGAPPCASASAAARCLLGAIIAEETAPTPLDAPLADIGKIRLEGCHLARDKNSKERVSTFLALCGHSGAKLTETQLIPGWALTELPKHTSPPRLMEWLQRRPPIWIRAQTEEIPALLDALSKAGLAPERHPSVMKAIKIPPTRVNLYSLPEFKAGLFEIQDLSSQCIGLACMAKPGEMWWDACAGGGGKSLQLADMMLRKGSVLATDTRDYKLQDLKKRAARAAFPNIRTAPWDGGQLRKKRQGIFDGVLVDAPCGSSGRWRRNPDARWIAEKGWIDELTELQFKIVSAASSGVKPGGVLVYATCSLFERENSGLVSRFLSSFKDFSLETFPSPLDGRSGDGSLSTMPWDADCDASFVARFRRG